MAFKKVVFDERNGQNNQSTRTDSKGCSFHIFSTSMPDNALIDFKIIKSNRSDDNKEW